MGGGGGGGGGRFLDPVGGLSGFRKVVYNNGNKMETTTFSLWA